MAEAKVEVVRVPAREREVEGRLVVASERELTPMVWEEEREDSLPVSEEETTLPMVVARIDYHAPMRRRTGTLLPRGAEKEVRNTTITETNIGVHPPGPR